VNNREKYIACLGIILGTFIILSSLRIVVLDTISMIGAIILIMGISISGYAAISKDVKFYLTWGSIIGIVGATLLFREIINPFLLLGVLIILLSLIILIPSRRS